MAWPSCRWLSRPWFSSSDLPLAPLQPGGTIGVAGEAAERLWHTQRAIEKLLYDIGGRPVATSTLVSYHDASHWLSMADTDRIRFIDRRSGDAISLRADLTTQVLALESLRAQGAGAASAEPTLLFASGAVFREQDIGEREFWQLTAEFLYDIDGQQLVRCGSAIVAILSLLGIGDATMVVASHNPHSGANLAQVSGRYVQPLSGKWYREFDSEHIPEWLASTLSGTDKGDLRVVFDRHLPPSRNYYTGDYWRIYVPGVQVPILSGGQYDDPNGTSRHVGFGVDLMAMSQVAGGAVANPKNMSSDSTSDSSQQK